ncbi:phage shock protein PspC (stress-responsive transcriptional regulator) [Neomicrococcus aestuarii]|uniref:Phage shock protein PspC (Stress-responsive transcriptional regulator) n=1 Tax=Neomicrococcus aestuarii TaxID=556325 RepID=A0A7W8X147_9MICC|nr:PspC domain-containing protein [Neomicrococcus aestuarii]MBB5513528.1 phage shock protein PspC (stress-responsive transcriptional regulator) [Neomicrococcus aestuarii]
MNDSLSPTPAEEPGHAPSDPSDDSRPEPPREPPRAPSREPGFFGWLRSLHMPRSQDRWIGGVVGGIANRIGIDPTLARGIFVVLGLLSLVGPLVYGVLWALLPEPDGRIHAQEAGRGRWSAGMTGATVFAAIGLFSSPGYFGRRWGNDGDAGDVIRVLLTLAVIGFIIYLITTTRGRRPNGSSWTATTTGTPGAASSEKATHASTASPSYSYSYQYDYPSSTAPLHSGSAPQSGTAQQPGAYTDPRAQERYERAMERERVARERAARPKLPGNIAMIFLGLALLTVGFLVFANIENWIPGFEITAGTIAAAALLVLGLGLVFAASTRRRGGALVPFTIVVLIFTMISAARDHTELTTYPAYVGTGAGVDQPTIFGTRTVDLRDVSNEISEDTTVSVTSAFSTLNLKVPNDRRVVIDAEAAFYSLSITDADGESSRSTGLAVNSPYIINGEVTGPTLTVNVEGAFSSLEVTTEEN